MTPLFSFRIFPNQLQHTKLLHLACFLFLTVLLSTPWFSNDAAAKPNIIPAPPQVSASSYLLMDAATGHIIVESNANTKLPPASLTKIMTIYVAAVELEKGNISLDDQVNISVTAWRKGGSKMYIREGEQVRLSDLMRGTVIQSGNDASIAIAEHIAGSEDAFADLMNLHAQALGMNSTYFANATGWPAEGHLTTATDMAILTRALIQQYPAHYALYKEKEFTFNEIKQPNRNLLLWRDQRVDGVKTGHTKAAGYCLIASAMQDEMRLISVVLGTNSPEARANQSLKLLNYGFRFYETTTPYTKHEIIDQPKVWMGQADTLPVGLDETTEITVARGQSESIGTDIVLNPIIKAPIQQGDVIGALTLVLDGEAIIERPLIALESVEQAGLFKRIWHWILLKITSLFASEE